MAKMFSENAQRIIRFLQDNPNVDLTAKELASAIGITSRSANGCITGLTRKGLAQRISIRGEAGVEYKVVRLTDMGRQVDPDADKRA